MMMMRKQEERWRGKDGEVREGEWGRGGAEGGGEGRRREEGGGEGRRSGQEGRGVGKYASYLLVSLTHTHHQLAIIQYMLQQYVYIYPMYILLNAGAVISSGVYERESARKTCTV